MKKNLEKDDLNKMVYTSDVITMLQDGLLKVLDGSTTFDEIYKIIDVDDDLDVYCKIRGINYNENNNIEKKYEETENKVIEIENKEKEDEIL